MKFAEVIEGLKLGHIYTNKKMKARNQCLACHINQTVPAEVVPRMNSIHQTLKRLLTESSITFHDQVLLLEWDREHGGDYLATSYTPTWEEIFAEDWIMLP